MCSVIEKACVEACDYLTNSSSSHLISYPHHTTYNEHLLGSPEVTSVGLTITGVDIMEF